MTAHVVSFTPAGAPTRAVCSQCGVIDDLALSLRELARSAERHAFFNRGSVEFAGLPPVEVTA